MSDRKRRRTAPRESAGPENTARWAELPREIVAVIASHTCPPVQRLPVTSLIHTTDPESTAYHRYEDPSFSGPGAQYAVGQGLAPPVPAGPMGQSAGGSGSGAGAGPSTAPGPSASHVAPGGVCTGAEAAGGAAECAVPGTFRPLRISDTALAMRAVCRMWCKVLSEGVRRVVLPQGTGTYTIWASHFPSISHLALGGCTDVQVRSPDQLASPPRRRGGGGAAASDGQAGSAAAAAAAAAASGGRWQAAARRGGSSGGGSGGGGSASAEAAAPSWHVRSLTALTSLRNLQVSDSSAHLDLAASCTWLDELVVWSQHQQYGSHPGRDAAAYGPVAGGGLGFAGGGGRRHRGGGGAAGAPAPAPASRRSALDRALFSLPGLQRLRLSGVDASAARLGSALMGLTGLTSLRLLQCRLPAFLGAPERARSGHHNFGRELVANLGAKLQDLSLQSCGVRILPDEVLAGLRGLRMLDLSANGLTVLPHTISLLTRLQYLDLQYNALHVLPEGMGAGLGSSLADLDLSGNMMHRLPADFSQLTALTHLHLGGLHGLDMGLCWTLLTALTNLHSLGLCDVDLSVEVGQPNPVAGGGGGGAGGAGAEEWRGPLHALVSALAPAARLRELMLDGCGLADLPPSFSDLTTLTHLSLMENFDASYVPAAVTGLRALAVLRLGYLDLSEPLPPGLFELTSLRELDLEQNFLPGLGAGISRLTNLQVLNLMDAFDPEAPDPESVIPWTALYALTRLRRLDIAGPEGAPRVARGISALAELEALTLHCVTLPGPVLEELFSGALRSCLVYLDLNACGIASLPQSITRMCRLAELQLSENKLTRLPAGFGALTRLTDLGLSGNERLRSLPADMTRLTRLRSLSWAVVHGVTPLPSHALLSWLARLPDLALHGNPRGFAELARAYNIAWPKRGYDY